ncbi:MAG: hypothetical protein CVV23_15370 [Ignavibacteriae bacterium HGW-Ignavibacteriae-2]|jgi:hypothetical protein|nr:hypothetical protein [Bacteroidota bacterium]PKL87422.1 MAG: hypothetical protein CVV23_15370 [Ignavibacteriae bacterium HGW-Ignavibacteriae-2]
MNEDFAEPVYRELDSKSSKKSGNVIKAEEFKIDGYAKVTVEEESLGGVKFVLKKDQNDVIKEIKFICSCGQSKSIVLDYSE